MVIFCNTWHLLVIFYGFFSPYQCFMSISVFHVVFRSFDGSEWFKVAWGTIVNHSKMFEQVPEKMQNNQSP